MDTLRIAVAQINTTVGDFEGNGHLIAGQLRAAREQGASLVVFPELALSGYPPEDLLLKRAFIDEARHAVELLMSESRGITAVVGLPVGDTNHVYNAAAVLADGEWVATYRKQLLPNYGVFDEQRYFTSGDAGLVIAMDGVNVGVTICEDIWCQRGPSAVTGVLGQAPIVVNISSSPYHRGKSDEREALLTERAAEARAVMVYVNLVGGQDELVFDGASLVIDVDGTILARGRQFEEELLLVDVNPSKALEASRQAETSTFSQALSKQSKAPDVVTLHTPIPDNDHSALAPQVARKAPQPEEVYRALVLGTRDYVQKNGFQRAVIGVSGGIDSALTLAVSCDAIGAERTSAVVMPSAYSSEATQSDARTLCEQFGVRQLEIPIHNVFVALVEALNTGCPSEELSAAEENLQARVRGTLLMALSNAFGWLVLTTGNKSEISTGYCTLYGDMAGGFAVLKDVFKTLVYDLAVWRNQQHELPHIPQSILDRPPSAELRPNQRDTDTLPPYDILDPILEAYVEQDLSIADILKGDVDEAVVRRIVRMVDRNEYKRRQGPVGMKITPKAFGRDRRMPVTNLFNG